jgi:hypothetical protein
MKSGKIFDESMKASDYHSNCHLFYGVPSLHNSNMKTFAKCGIKSANVRH